MSARVALMGSGSAAELYMEQAQANCSLSFVACADVETGRAAALAESYGIPRACTPDELLAATDVEIVINLTPAAEHGRSGLEILSAGKHLFTEKPLAPTVAEGARLLDCARRRGLRIGCAPDTFLARGLQTARALIDHGYVGSPFAASATVAMIQPESWHPRPATFYGDAAGPLFDMGPYYITALVALLGPVARVAGFGTVAPRERRAVSGELIEPTVPSHDVAILEFTGGAVASLVASFDAARSAAPPIEIHGTLGTLRLPDPNHGAGAVCSCRHGQWEWVEEPVGAAGGQSRCIGIEDMADAIREGRPHRASGELGLHVLDVMESLRRSQASHRVLRLRTTCERPEPLEA